MTPSVSRLMVENALLRLLSDLPPETESMVVQARLNGLAVELRIGTPLDIPMAKVGIGTFELTRRHREVLNATRAEIARLGRRVIGAEIRAALTAAGLPWGLSTINTTLADLVHEGFLTNHNDKRGYGLPPEPKP